MSVYYRTHLKKIFQIFEGLDKVLLVVLFLYENILYVCVIHDFFILETKRQSHY